MTFSQKTDIQNPAYSEQKKTNIPFIDFVTIASFYCQILSFQHDSALTVLQLKTFCRNLVKRTAFIL